MGKRHQQPITLENKKLNVNTNYKTYNYGCELLVESILIQINDRNDGRVAFQLSTIFTQRSIL